MKFIIDRSKWRAGKDGPYACGKGPTLLENMEGYQCCLGQISLALGVPKNALLAVATPQWLKQPFRDSLKDVLISQEGMLVNIDSPLSERAMTINDSVYFTREQRETELKNLFASNNHEIEFVGEYVDFRN